MKYIIGPIIFAIWFILETAWNFKFPCRGEVKNKWAIMVTI